MKGYRPGITRAARECPHGPRANVRRKVRGRYKLYNIINHCGPYTARLAARAYAGEMDASAQSIRRDPMATTMYIYY